MLVQTVELLMQDPGAEAPRLLLEQTLRAEPLTKPADHRGGKDMIVVKRRSDVEDGLIDVNIPLNFTGLGIQAAELTTG